nr:MAG TPA: restriction endonuclease [Caudoviricetes sp.]
MAARSPGKRTASKKEPKKKYLCPYCNTEKDETQFYMSSDPLVMTGKTSMCKECAEKIARNWDERTKEYHDCTKASVQEALERLDKPYLDKIWDASYFEYVNDNSGKKRTNIWAAYIKNIGMQQYRGMRWRDGDLFTSYKESAIKQARQEVQNDELPEEDKEINEEYVKNRADVIRLLGYDPFEHEQEEDKPLLYSQLIGYLDTSGENDDMMRTSSAITIVRGFLQQAKLDDMIAKAMSSPNVNNRSGEIKSYLDSKKNVASTVSLLAEQSCLSLKHNKNQSKGENTWTGKIKKIKELNLREGEVNGFDIATCKGMQQVMDLSNASILKQLALDESEYSSIIAEQRKLVTNLTTERDSYKEICRILLRENLDLKDVLSDNNLLSQENLTDLNELFSAFSDIEADEEVSDDEKSDENQDS